MTDVKIQELLNELRKDNSSGASQLIKDTIKIIKSQLNSIQNEDKNINDIVIKLSNEIINSRPSMAPLINTIGYLISDMDLITKESLLQRISQFINDKNKREKAKELAFQTFLHENYRDGLRIMLISYSSTIINLLIKFKEYNIELFILESRPLLEGLRTATILSTYFKTNLIIDAAIGKFIDQIDLVLIGIDSVLSDGSIVNKIGTNPLAVLAYENNVNVYAVGDSFKYNLKSHYGQNVSIENKPISEVYDKEILSENLEVHNYYFDITPPKYVSGIISDLGVLSIPNFLSEVKKVLPIKWFKSFLVNKE